jgi:hypothetical protein
MFWVVIEWSRQVVEEVGGTSCICVIVASVRNPRDEQRVYFVEYL